MMRTTMLRALAMTVLLSAGTALALGLVLARLLVDETVSAQIAADILAST